MKTYRYLTYLCLSSLCLLPKAQSLSTEITVDRTVLPEQHAATRPTLMPSLASIDNHDVRLVPAEYSEPGTLTALVATLPVAPWDDKIPQNPYRGYVRAGIFPTFNALADARYRFVEDKKLIVDGWASGSALAYKRKGVKMRELFGSVGACVDYKANSYSRLLAKAAYTYSSILHPRDDNGNGDAEGNNFYRARIAWVSQPSAISYDAEAGYQCFIFGERDMSWNTAITSGSYNYKSTLGQSLIDVKAGIGLKQSESEPRWVGIDADGQWIDTNHNFGSLGQYHVAPYVRWHNDQASATIGANLSFGSGDDAKARIAPKVRVAYEPQGSLVWAWVSFTGGERLNPLSELYAKNHYISPYLAYGRTNIPLDIEGAVTIGRVQGLAVQIFGGYALARNLLMPVLTNTASASTYTGARWLSIYGGNNLNGYDVNSWHAGAKIDYYYKNLWSAGISAETGGSDQDSAYDEITWKDWQDRAKYIASAYVKATPIKPLDICLSYEMRSDRSVPYYNGQWRKGDIGNVYNLNLGAAYQISDQLSLGLELDNLLNHHYMNTLLLMSQGLHGLASVTFKF